MSHITFICTTSKIEQCINLGFSFLHRYMSQVSSLKSTTSSEVLSLEFKSGHRSLCLSRTCNFSQHLSLKEMSDFSLSLLLLVAPLPLID